MKYKVYYTAHMCDHVYVEAESKDDAHEIAMEKAEYDHDEADHIDIKMSDIISEDNLYFRDKETNSTPNYHAS